LDAGRFSCCGDRGRRDADARAAGRARLTVLPLAKRLKAEYSPTVQPVVARVPRLVAAIALLALFAFAAGCSAQSPRTPVDPTADVDGVPGALPVRFHFSYRDSYRGWPLWPLHRQHPIRSSFLDPRGIDERGWGNYHFGVDISVDDQHPVPGAPRGFSHRVFAIESGEASDVQGAPQYHCSERRLLVGHFAYWHVSPTVALGEHVQAGTQIGWSCLGEWHVHVSEWTLFRGHRVWVNPLHAGGKIAPYRDTARPIVSRLSFFSAPTHGGPAEAAVDTRQRLRRLTPSWLYGPVELRAMIGDPQSFWGFIRRHPRWMTLVHPDRVAVVIRTEETHTTVLRRVSFQSDQLPSTPYLVHYAPGTVETKPIPECLASPPRTRCAGRYWFRPFSRFQQEFWDTRNVADGTYDVTVRAWDLKGNEGSATTRVVVANRSPASEAARKDGDSAAASRLR